MSDECFGIRIIEDRFCYKREHVQFRFPRSKKVRIRRKFAKQAKNFKSVIKPTAYRIGDMLIVHPSIADQIMKHAKGKN